MTEVTNEFDVLIANGRVFDFYGVDNNFMKLDNEVWEVVEDESDGYRSYLDTVRKLPLNGIFFSSPVARVRIEYRVEGYDNHLNHLNHLYHLIDIEDGHVWLTFGTMDADDYYPYFHFEYQAKPPVGEEVATV